jgi:phosphohistidine swiveling domain-containing protein
MVTVDYACADGTRFPVTFASEEDAALEWHLEQEHSVGPQSPLAAAMARLGRPGAARAYGEAGLPVPAMWRAGPRANGWPYYVASMPQGDEMAALFEGCGRLVQEHGSALGIWRHHSLPRVRASIEWLRSAGPEVAFAALAERETYAQHHTMVSSMVTWNDMRLVTEICVPLYGADAELVGYELSQGHPNATLAADQDLWTLAQVARDDARVLQALASDCPSAALADLRTAGSSAPFFDALARHLEVHAMRCESWTIDSPTCGELGTAFASQVLQRARDGGPSPAEIIERAAERRRALVDEIDRALAGDATQQQRFHRRVDRLSDYVPVREERAHWQLVATGALRHALLRRGEALVDADRLDAPGDIFFCEPEDIEDAAVDLRAVAASGRAAHEHWAAVRPPLVVGGTAATSAEAPVDGARAVVLRGAPGSRGIATGRACVVTDLADADRIEPGDVLVCTMTSPPWTPLFAVAAAVVTETGTLGSHAAIAAREYGIPCVVGVTAATVTIPDGGHVTVDGEAGTIAIDEAPLRG